MDGVSPRTVTKPAPPPIVLTRDTGYRISATIFTPEGVHRWWDVCRAYDAEKRTGFVKRLLEYSSALGVAADESLKHFLHQELIRIAEEQIVNEEKGATHSENSNGYQGQKLRIQETEPWNEEVRLAEVLDEITCAIGTYVWARQEALWTAALWAAWTWVFDRFYVAPILFVTSPTKRCGKTRLLDCLSAIVRRPLMATPSPASLFRTIELYRPTFIVDEVDNLVRQDEEWRLLLNAGHTKRTATVVRSVGDDFEPRFFSIWGPKALGGIGDLASTTSDRAIILRLARKPPDVRVARLTESAIRGLHPLAQKLARWAIDSIDPDSPPEWPVPDAPPELDDRAADNWGPLLAIADMAGGDWPEKARQAAVIISADTREEKDYASLLLRDSFLAFRGEEELTATELTNRLCEDPLAPWSTFSRGDKPISPKRVAQMLARFSIRPTHTRRGNCYYRADFEPVVKAYFPTILGLKSFNPSHLDVTPEKITTYDMKAFSESDIAVS